MRRFYIENEKGQRKSLSGGDAWLTAPQGLGVSTDGTYAEIGGGFFRDVAGGIHPRIPIVGNLVFTRGEDAYRKYRDLTGWMLSAEKLYLVYCPYGDTEYFRGVTIEYLNKGELGTGKFLTVPFSFRPTTPWFLQTPKRTVIYFLENEDNAKRYAYPYGYKYVENVARATAEVKATGHIPAGIVFTYAGAMEKPAILLYGKQTGTMYGNVAVDVNTGAGDTLEFSSRYDESFIRLRQSGGTVVDLIDAVDITQEVFFRAPVGETCVFEVTSESKMTGAAQMAVFDYFRTV